MQQSKGKRSDTLYINATYGELSGWDYLSRYLGVNEKNIKITKVSISCRVKNSATFKTADNTYKYEIVTLYLVLLGWAKKFILGSGQRGGIRYTADLNSSELEELNACYQKGSFQKERATFYNSTYAYDLNGEVRISWEVNEGCEIRDIEIKSEDERKSVEVKWRSKHQERYYLEVKSGSRVEYSTSGYSQTYVTIPALTAGDKKINIKIEDTLGGRYTDNYAIESKSFTIKSTSPKITEIKTKTYNIDNGKGLEWASERQEKYKLIVNGHEYTGTTQKQCKLKLEDLVWGQNTATLTLSNEDEGITATDTKSFNFTVTADNPIITALDPSDVDVNIEKNVIVTWMTVPEQTSFALKANNEVFNGDKQETITIPAGVFVKGSNTIEITVTREILGQTLTGTKKVTFNGYGKPDKPTFEDVTIYDTALPIINWTAAQAQEAFNIVIGEENKEIVSKDTNYKLTKPLKNNNSYTLKLRIKNKYGLWSDFAEKQIKVSYAVLAKPELELFENQGIITINIINNADMNFKKCELWRRTEFSEWEKIEDNLRGRASIQDNTIASDIDYYYKAIAYTIKEGMSESLVKRIKASLESTLIIDVESGKKIKISYFLNENPEIKVKRIQDIQHVRYQGKRAPDVEIGETDYKEINIRTVFKSYKDFKNFESFIDNSNLLLFKDSVGRAIYCTLGAWGDEEVNIFKQTVISVKLIESLNYVKSFRSENKKTVLKLDQGWKMDTGLKFDDKSYI